MAIFGVVVTNESGLVETVLKAMMTPSAISAGDVHESCVLPQAGLGVVSSTGKTSLSNSEGLTVVCDAELYNQDELEREISPSLSHGHSASLIAALYLRHGVAFLQRLRGIFSIAVWDSRSRALLLARDRFGVRPLCYAARPSEIIFASHPSGILQSQRVAKNVDRHAIVEYLTYNIVPAPKTAFEGITKLNPGEWLLWKDGNTHSGRYWDLQYTEDARDSRDVLAHQLLSQMEDSVRVTSADTDPARTGCFLSGGTDSTSIVALLTTSQGRPTNTFSIGFSEPQFNELEYARIAARHYQTNHHECIVSPADAFTAIEKIVKAYDEPFANASAVPAYLCAKLASERGIDVLLAGDGGDELFGGNERYAGDQIYALYGKLPRLLRRWIIEPAVFASPFSPSLIKRAQKYIKRSYMPNPERFCIIRHGVLEGFSMEEVLATGMPIPPDRLSILRAHYDAAPAKSELNRLLYVDIKMTLGDEDVPKVVRTAEIAGISVRFPYLDHMLAEFSGRLPAGLKVRGLEKRYLFKRATRSLLPPAILRKKKHGFGLPIGLWLKTDAKLRDFSRNVLLDPRTYQRGYFRREFIEKIISSFDADHTPYSINFGEVIYEFMMLELWHRYHIEGKS